MENPFAKFSDWLQRLPLYTLVASGLIFFVLIASIAGALVYIKSRSPEMFLSNFNEAILRNETERLQKLVDFSTLGQNVATKYFQVLGKTPTADEQKKAADMVQTEVFDLFNAIAELRPGGRPAQEENAKDEKKDEKKIEPLPGSAEAGKQAPHAASKESILEKVTPPLGFPLDSLLQFKLIPFRVHTQSDNLMILTAPFTNSLLNYSYPVRLVVTNGPNGWQVTDLANAQEFIQTHLRALKENEQAKIDAFHLENANRKRLMTTHYYVMGCRAFLIKDRAKNEELPLVISLEGVNMGTHTLVSAGMICNILDKSGNLLAQVPLNTTKQVVPSATFSQTWQIELSRDFPETAVLLKEPSLQCSVDLSAVSLSDGQFIYVRPQKDLEKIMKQ